MAFLIVHLKRDTEQRGNARRTRASPRLKMGCILALLFFLRLRNGSIYQMDAAGENLIETTTQKKRFFNFSSERLISRRMRDLKDIKESKEKLVETKEGERAE